MVFSGVTSGDERIKRKMDLDIAVTQLRTAYSNFLDNRRSLKTDIVKKYPEQIRQKTEIISGLQKDIALAESHKTEEFSGMTIKGNVITDKKQAGEALLSAVKTMGIENIGTKIGEYKGFEMQFDFIKSKGAYALNLKGSLSHSVELGKDPLGNLTRIENALSALPTYLENNKLKLEELKGQLEVAKQEAEKPFARIDDLRDMEKELSDLNKELSIEKEDESEILPEETEKTTSEPNRYENVR